MNEIMECKPGTKVLWDSFTGMVKAIYLEKIDDRNIEIKITAKTNIAYYCNETIVVSSMHVIPRQCYHRTGIFRYAIYPNYVFV